MRTFSEVYRLYPGVDSWKNDTDASIDKAVCSVLPEKKMIERGVPYPEFDRLPALWEVSNGKIERDVPVEKIKDLSTLFHIGNKFKGFPKEELEAIPFIELQKVKNAADTEIQKPYEFNGKIILKDNAYHIFDFGTNFTGFIGARIKCNKSTRLFLTFDELLTDGDVDFKRLGCTNVVEYTMPAGTYEIETFEPYTLRYLKLLVFDGECEVENIYLRDYANPESYKAHFAASDERLNILFDAGRETFRQNAVDIFTDCPSRERAGWLCDSYFTARAGFNLCGNTTVEKNFFENYMLPEKFDYHPEGMLPMNYPAEHYDERFIPNWAMFFVIQLDEYLERSGDRVMADALKDKVLKLLDYFVKFENEDGLLEKLENWVFIEWSRASDFVQDVNYPTNMLYAAVLDAAGRMYNIPKLLTKSENIREVIRKQSFNGEFFVDNAMRKNGKLEVTRNRSEVCQ
ncbi:family 78 glycoside hydrolase catalytic domain, partial [bacterium]|nr:family 78 glycoside hydrolase catalytic domain [bacterium]